MTHIQIPIQMKSVQRGLISVVNLKVMFPGTRSAGLIHELQKFVFLMPTQFRISRQWWHGTPVHCLAS